MGAPLPPAHGPLLNATEPAQQDEGYAQIPPASLLAWVAPDLLAKALRRDLEQAYEALPASMSSSARLAELAKLDRDIASVEAAIASAFWTAIDSGLSPAVPSIDGGRLIGLTDQ